MLPDDVVFADIPRHALDIFLHAPGSAHKNGIVKTNIRSHIHSHSPVRTPKATEEQNPQLTKHDAFLCLSNVVVGDDQEAWQMPLRNGPRRRPSYLGQY